MTSNFDLLLTDDRENRLGEDPIDVESAVDEGDGAGTREGHQGQERDHETGHCNIGIICFCVVFFPTSGFKNMK